LTWPTATPESQGLSGEKLAALKDSLAARQTKAFLVLRNGRIVFEWYAPGHAAGKQHYAASLSKPIVAALALALLLGDGQVKLDDRAATYIPQWADDPRKSRITLRHLGSHTSGLADAEDRGMPHEKLTGWQGDFWKRLDPPNDPFTIARDRTPLRFDAGKDMQYSNPGIAMLGYALTAALKKAPQKDLRTLLRERVLRPLGVPDNEWSVGYGKTFNVDGLPLVAPWGGGNFTARAVARIGELLLHKGNWNGKQLLSAEAVRQSTSHAGLPGNCGIAWWTNFDGRYASLPRDAFWGSGAGHQILLVVPSLNLIAVRNGGMLAAAAGEPTKYHEPVRRFLFEPLMEAVLARAAPQEGAAPYPPSKAIPRIEWAPKETIVCKARGSDNWPLTWADDDHMYTAYGDGWGFEPKLPIKLGLGFARVEGGPTAFTGANIRSPSGEQIGDGARAKKASGMLMVDGVLYMWTRNAGNAQLAWSVDRGRTWKWSDWKFTTSFGCPTFLNYGKNYAGARDDFVYVYSHDAASAYEPADRMVLARVPQQQITRREAYEFLKGVGKDGKPVWTRNIEERGAVFTHRGKCYRSGISYNAGLKCYLWCQTLPGGDARFKGGFGIYDAPEPWGPWTTVFYTPQWDVGPGETSSFPTKWMSKDGRTLYLVFSGEDSFSVRKLTVAPAPPKADPRALREAATNNGGNPKRGAALFASATTRCAVCHKVHGHGGDVGPDLSQIGGKLDRTHLIESILDPSAQIPEGFHTTMIVTASGRVVTGIVRSESATAVNLLDAEGKPIAIPIGEIESRQVSKVSLMPAGLADTMTPAEFTDLIAYLESLRTGRMATPGEGIASPLTLPPGFKAEVVATGLTGVTALEVARDGRIFVCEQTGALRIVKQGKLLAQPFVRLPVDATWERGLIGVTVAPDFPGTPHIFVCYVAAKPYPHHVVSRFTAAGDVAETASEHILLEGDDQRKLGGNVPAGHQGGAIHFGKDGKLYVALGDQTAGKPAQELNSLLGRLLRINADGTIPDDNPFISKVTGKYRATWALGLRNPFTFAVQPETGRLFINDVGGRAEEINEGMAGANYGWPIVEHGPTSDRRFRGPIHHYPTACIAGGAFAPQHLAWPQEYRSRYFFGDFNHGWIKTLDPSKPEVAQAFAVGLRRPVDLRFGPDGCLYVLVRDAWVIDRLFKGGTGALLRIRPTGK
jgi:putative heme-binding domain-containing protein